MRNIVILAVLQNMTLIIQLKCSKVSCLREVIGLSLGYVDNGSYLGFVIFWVAAT